MEGENKSKHNDEGSYCARIVWVWGVALKSDGTDDGTVYAGQPVRHTLAAVVLWPVVL